MSPTTDPRGRAPVTTIVSSLLLVDMSASSASGCAAGAAAASAAGAGASCAKAGSGTSKAALASSEETKIHEAFQTV